MNLLRIQEELKRQQLDGWLFFDHHGRDPLAYRILGLAQPAHVSRRWYYLIPSDGDPKALVHRVESSILDSLPGQKFQYAGWQEHHSMLRLLLGGTGRVAMQYSPFCNIPYVALVDAGTVELVRGTGCEVVSSAELVQHFEATLDEEDLSTHLEAGRRVDAVREEAFRLIADKTRSGSELSEFEVARFIQKRFSEMSLVSENCPIVGVNGNAGKPHYEPVAAQSSNIQLNDFVLLDMWARLNQANSVYYDITWTGFCGTEVPDRISKVFTVVRDARDAAITRVRSAIYNKEQLCGFQVDDAARNHINAHGFGDKFIHRTGHSIGKEVHGNGANMDNYEIHDERKLIPWTCFSIEPGIYLEDFGIRSEINMFLKDTEAIVTGAIQTELVKIA